MELLAVYDIETKHTSVIAQPDIIKAMAMIDWCVANFGYSSQGRWKIRTASWHFTTAADKLLFILKWGE